MYTTEILDYMIGKFGLDRVDTKDDGTPLYVFAEPFSFLVAEFSIDVITLVAPLDLGNAIDRTVVLHRLLESNLQGCETGAGAICLIDGYGICYRETVDLKDMTLDAFQSRFVDFSLYAYYWLSEGIKTVQDETSAPIMGEGMIRL